MMGVLICFLEFKIKQSERSISINQENYVKDMLNKYDINGSLVKTLMAPPNNLGLDLNDNAINETQYRGIIGSLMYLTTSRLDIQFSTCLGERYQANPKESHLIVVKRIFKYLKGSELQGKENGVNILKSIDEGPFQMGTFRETLTEVTKGAPHLGLERPRAYLDLSPEDKERYNADIRATNILLQGLPKDIYSLINHYTDEKDIWDNVKMLLEGSELTKEDRESQLYDDFKHFRQNKGETIHDYYVRFAKLINDMRNIKMTMSKMQLNSKFVNNMLLE
ncbi:hypothetical protein Tco_0115746 [Tanacetum coccineum]